MGRHAMGLTPTIGQLRPWHKAICRAMVSRGLRPFELAQIFSLSASQITQIINSPLFIAEQNRLESLAEVEAVDVRRELEARQGLAIDTIDSLLTSDQAPPNVKKDLALEILDRTGYAKAQAPQRHLHLHAHADVKDMSTEELAKDVAGLIEAEVVDG